MEEQILQSLSAILAYVEQGAAFAAEQAPLVVQEIIAWGIYGNAISLVLYATLMVVCGRYAIHGIGYAVKDAKKSYSEQSEGLQVFYAITGGISTLGVPIFGVLAIESAFHLAKVLVAPRLYVIQYLGSVIN